MEKGKITEIRDNAPSPSFFFDQWKHALTHPEPDAAAKEPTQLRDAAHTSLHKYKQSLLEYQKTQQAHRLWKEKTAQADSPRELAMASQTLRRLEAQLDSLERELRAFRHKTKSALEDYRAAS